jgi:hypothetical protein
MSALRKVAASSMQVLTPAHPFLRCISIARMRGLGLPQEKGCMSCPTTDHQRTTTGAASDRQRRAAVGFWVSTRTSKESSPPCLRMQLNPLGQGQWTANSPWKGGRVLLSDATRDSCSLFARRAWRPLRRTRPPRFLRASQDPPPPQIDCLLLRNRGPVL